MERRFLGGVALLATLAAGCGGASSAPGTERDWPNYGNDPGGARSSPVTQITPGNVSQLAIAWTFHTGEKGIAPRRGRQPALETTPLVVDSTMYLTTPLGRVIALDPATGSEQWRYDSHVDVNGGYGDFTNRGAATWFDASAAPGAACRRSVYIATIDARLISLDARTGTPCAAFGDGGTVDLRQGLRVAPFEFPAYEETSAPAVINGMIVVGSAIADNSRLAPASGEVRAFDAKTGALRWSWDPIPQSPQDPAASTWREGSAARTGAANAWSIIVTDPARDLVFVPTGSPAPDYFGGERLGENRYGNSVTALRGSTGEVVWSFQTVHHDLWDYDNASPPALVTIVKDGRTIPALLQANKNGMLYVLDRTDGKPVFPIEERPVPPSDIPGEEAWPTQPFTAVTPPLAPHGFTADSIWGATPADREACRHRLGGLRMGSIYMPPSTQGTVVRPSNIGGANWGGVAADSARGIAVVAVNTLIAEVQLIPIGDLDRPDFKREEGFEYTRMRGTPWAMRREIVMSPSGLPCSPPPFARLVGVDLATGGIRWTVPLGDLPAPAGAEVSHPTGAPSLGGAIVTASGLTFIGSTMDRRFRAFDTESGKELWSAELPAGARATPMTYEVGGRQFVVIAAGGGDVFGEGDAVVAFALPAGGR